MLTAWIFSTVLAWLRQPSPAKMTDPQQLELTPAAAARFVTAELSLAKKMLLEEKVDAALDSYVRALGMALQLGPAPTDEAVTSILQAAQHLTSHEDAVSLSALGPALVGLVNQMRIANAVPVTAVMEAWAQFLEGLGALIGQIGLAMAVPGGHGSGMMANARSHAELLDDASGSRYALAAWIDGFLQ